MALFLFRERELLWPGYILVQGFLPERFSRHRRPIHMPDRSHLVYKRRKIPVYQVGDRHPQFLFLISVKLQTWRPSIRMLWPACSNVQSKCVRCWETESNGSGPSDGPSVNNGQRTKTGQSTSAILGHTEMEDVIGNASNEHTGESRRYAGRRVIATGISVTLQS